MKSKLNAFYFVILFSFRFFGGNTDSLIRFNHLEFKNDFERNTFKSYGSSAKSADIIDLFLAHYSNKESYNSSKVHQQINECVYNLKKETEGQAEPKKVKTIYKYVHQHFFKVYKLHNSFSDVFEKGEYNCVSGSALYAIVFQLMDIPYQIVEAPQHVFLFAYPDSHKILIETTSPDKGYFNLSEVYVEKFIKYMYESKLISKEEYEGNSVNALFNKYYFATKGLSLHELAGVQYSNYTVYYIEDNEHEKALEEIKKAYFISPNQRNKYLLQAVLSYAIVNRNYKSERDVKNLAILCGFNNLNKKEISDEKIKYEFGRLTHEQLINNSNYNDYDKSYELIYKAINDSVLKNEIAFNYHYELARLGYMNTKDKGYEMGHLKAAYEINPKHADLQNIISAYFGRRVENSNDPVLIMKEIDEFSKTFNYLTDNGKFNSGKANCLLELAYQKFMLKDITKGESYLTEFEALCKKNEDIKATEKYVEKAYSTAASYYYKKGNTAKTKELLRTGIKYAPENFGLRIRLSQVH